MKLEAAPLFDANGCLSEDEVLAFAGGQLEVGSREQAHRHLDVCEACQELLNEAVRALAMARTKSSDEPEALVWSATFRAGVVVGDRYWIQRFVARGGMGEVYEALDQELQERVALKTVTSTASDDPHAARRLKAEVQLARRVSHPNVCRIYDFGSHRSRDSLPLSFLTMAFVEGETLGARLRRAGALPVGEASRLARALLQGLAAAHAAGVLHRDLKSDNVMLRREGEGTTPIIMDFGLARAFEHDGRSSASRRGLVGTIAYMAPEQLKGLPHSTASDIYSFGLVWFEMLTGQLPFKTHSSPVTTTLKRLTKAIAPPSSLNPLVPSELDQLVLACLRREVRDRLPTADAVLARLDELEHGERKPTPKRTPRAALILTALALAGAAFWLTQAAPQRSSASGGVMPRKDVALPASPAAVPPAAPPAPTPSNSTGLSVELNQPLDRRTPPRDP